MFIVKFRFFLACWVPIALQAFSSCGEWGLLSSCSAWGVTLQRLLLLQSTGSRASCRSRGQRAQQLQLPGLARTGSIVGDGLSCSGPRGLFPGQGAHLLLRHWQVDSLLSPQGSLHSLLTAPHTALRTMTKPDTAQAHFTTHDPL